MANREFLVSGLIMDEDKLFSLRFGTMKDFSDWFNSNKFRRIGIYAISEVPADLACDKYFGDNLKKDILADITNSDKKELWDALIRKLFFGGDEK